MIRPIQEPTHQIVAIQIETRIGEQSFNKSWKIIHFAEFSKVSENTLLCLGPSTVVCPLFTNRFDVIDVANLLQRANHQCRILIDAPPLPRPAMVLREIRDACPGTDVEFFKVLDGREPELLRATY